MSTSEDLPELGENQAPASVESEQEAVVDPAEKKAERLRKEKRELIDSLASGDFSTQRARVAYILNLYPSARNSDIVLALKYWAEFQPAFFNPEGIKPEHLFELEHVPLLVRAPMLST
jgi:DNA mismatch repair protein MutH